MASDRILQNKKKVVEEIKNKLEASKTFLLVNYQGLTVSEFESLRKNLKADGSEVKVYKNTLMNLALKDEKIELGDEFMCGANAFVFSENIIEPIKVISEFAKKNDNLKIKVGYIDGEVAGATTINEYASIPSYEGLLTMFAGGLMEHVRNLSIGLNLYAEKLENEGGEK